MFSRLPVERFPHGYVLDTEYQQEGGEQHRPVCLVAHGFNKGHRVEAFFDRPQPCPFPDLGNTVFVGFTCRRN